MKVSALVSSARERRYGSTGAYPEDLRGVPCSPSSPGKRKLFPEEAGPERGGVKEGRLGERAGAGEQEGEGEGEGGGQGLEEGEAVLSPVLSPAPPPLGGAGLRAAASPEPQRDSSPEPECHSPQGHLSCCGSTGEASLSHVTPFSFPGAHV